LLEWIFLVFVIPLGILFEGIERKLTARMQNRVGPPVWQPLYDIIKLLQKGGTDSRAKDNAFFRVCPFLYLVSSFFLFLFVPFSLLAFEYDFILLVYVTILCSGFYVLVGFASNSPYSIVGSMREVITMVAAEMVLAVVIFSFMVGHGINTLAAYPTGLPFLAAPLAAVLLFFVIILDIKITPFDTAEAPTEIMHGYSTEFSSRSLAFMELAKYLKLMFFSFLATFLLFGPINIFLFILVSIIVLFFLTYEKVTTPRYRVDQTFKAFIPVLILALAQLAWLVVI
jgi:formate hydrogenlyase subunit 4